MTRQVKCAWWVGQAIKDLETSVYAVTAGLGAGKTHGLCQWHHERAQRNYNADISFFVEPTYRLIQQGAIPKYRKVLSDFGLVAGRDYRLYKSPFPRIVYKNLPHEHEVHFISGDNPDLIVSADISHATEDESGIIPREVTSNISARIRDNRAEVRQFFRGGAPQGVNDFAEAFDSDTQEGWDRSIDRDHTKDLEIEDVLVRYRRFTVWTDDNSYLPPDYIAKNIMAPFGHNPNLIKSYRYGLFCPLVEGVVYKNYYPQKHDCDDIKADVHRDIYIDLDFNAAPLAWVASQLLPFEQYGKRIFRNVAIDEGNEGAENLDDAAVEVAHKFPPSLYGSTPIKLYGDRSGHAKNHRLSGSDFESLKKYLHELGFSNVTILAARQVAGEAASADALNRLFSLNLFLICRRCSMLRRSLQATCWKKGTRNIEKKSGETHTHHSDAVKYRAWQEMRDFIGKTTTKIYGKN